jgi:hypothetical protein
MKCSASRLLQSGVIKKLNLHASNMRMAEAVMFDGDVLQHPTTPVMKETNMKKKATMNKAIIDRPISAMESEIERKVRVLSFDIAIKFMVYQANCCCT